LPPLSYTEKGIAIMQHIQALHAFYGEQAGVKIARKHIAWYGSHLHFPAAWRSSFNHLSQAHQQIAALSQVISTQVTSTGHAPETGEVMAA
jgi:tRNA-dihydrouridine synthase B